MMKKALFIAVAAAMVSLTAQAKDIRIVEISTGSGMSSSYESSAKTALSALAGISEIVADVANLVLTVTYDADKVSVDDIVNQINKQEPRFEAKQKSEAKTKAWVKAEQKQAKAEQKVAEEKEAAAQKDQQKTQSTTAAGKNGSQTTTQQTSQQPATTQQQSTAQPAQQQQPTGK